MNTTSRKIYLHSLFIGLGILFIFLTVSPNIHFGESYIIKYDYFLQHIPYYEEFFRLLSKGAPFWSWNQFLGTNFWGSKSIYLIGDPFAWFAFVVNLIVKNVAISMSYILILKFVVGYLGFYILLSFRKAEPAFGMLLSLIFIYSGWNTIFIEQPFFTSFYVLIPYLLIGVEQFFKNRRFSIFIVSVSLLISTCYYMFWPGAILLLIYWITRYIQVNHIFKIRSFITDSFILLFYLIVGLFISGIIWLPGLFHMLTSTRIGNFLNTYENWSNINIASFFMFSFVPILKYLDGILKDDWYYFNQFGLYYGVFSMLLLPHLLYILKSKKERWIHIILVLFIYVLLLSPKIGFLFHFTYSLRYTFIITILGILTVNEILNRINYIKWYVVAFIQLVLSSTYFIFNTSILYGLYSKLPSVLLELELFKFAHLLSLVYSSILFVISLNSLYFKKNIILKTALLTFVIIGLFETSNQVNYALTSQNAKQDFQDKSPIELSSGYVSALNFLKNYDSGFYRIYQNNSYFLNVNQIYNYPSISVYDSMFQYSLRDFLVWSRQYPDTNWSFFYSEPAFNQILATRYAIIDTKIEPNYMSSTYYADEIGIEQNFGNYKVFRYKQNSHMAFTYNQIKSITEMLEYTKNDGDYQLFAVGDMLNNYLFLDQDLYDFSALSPFINNHEYIQKFFDPVYYNNNSIAFEIELEIPSMVFFSIPFDEGWNIKANDSDVEPLIVQGGFIGIPLQNGHTTLEMKYVPRGFYLGGFLSLCGILTFVILNFLYFRKQRS